MSATLQSKTGLALVLLAHAVVLYFLAQKQITATQQLAQIKPIGQAKPMMVSLIAAPTPALAPPKPLIETKPTKSVLKIKPVIRQSERMIEVENEPIELVKDALLAAPVLVPAVASVVKTEQPAQKIIENMAKNEAPKNDEIEPPRFGVAYLNNPAPDYPSMSRRMGEEGRVLMKVLVTAAGEASDVQLEKSSGSDRLDNAAINAVKRWRFVPAKKNNLPLSAYVLVPMKFALNS